MELNLAVEEETKIAAHLQRACDEADAQMSEVRTPLQEHLSTAASLDCCPSKPVILEKLQFVGL